MGISSVYNSTRCMPIVYVEGVLHMQSAYLGALRTGFSCLRAVPKLCLGQALLHVCNIRSLSAKFLPSASSNFQSTHSGVACTV